MLTTSTREPPVLLLGALRAFSLAQTFTMWKGEPRPRTIPAKRKISAASQAQESTASARDGRIHQPSPLKRRCNWNYSTLTPIPPPPPPQIIVIPPSPPPAAGRSGSDCCNFDFVY
ncbi:hypothetical protein VTO73DRAFT_4591 [Trametes versicolor]